MEIKEVTTVSTKDKIIRKLTSRKMWLAISEFVSMLIVFFGYAEETATKVAALIMAGAGALAYVIAEGLIDARNKGKSEG